VRTRLPQGNGPRGGSPPPAGEGQLIMLRNLPGRRRPPPHSGSSYAATTPWSTETSSHLISWPWCRGSSLSTSVEGGVPGQTKRDPPTGQAQRDSLHHGGHSSHEPSRPGNRADRSRDGHAGQSGDSSGASPSSAAESTSPYSQFQIHALDYHLDMSQLRCENPLTPAARAWQNSNPLRFALKWLPLLHLRHQLPRERAESQLPSCETKR
jgi:hypothetical protein